MINDDVSDMSIFNNNRNVMSMWNIVFLIIRLGHVVRKSPHDAAWCFVHKLHMTTVKLKRYKCVHSK